MTNRRRHNPLAGLDPVLAAELARGATPTAPGGNGSNRSKSTYDLRPDTCAAVKTIATELEVPIYAVVQKFLDYALIEYRADRLELRRQAITTTWRLE